MQKLNIELPTKRRTVQDKVAQLRQKEEKARQEREALQDQMEAEEEANRKDRVLAETNKLRVESDTLRREIQRADQEIGKFFVKMHELSTNRARLIRDYNQHKAVAGQRLVPAGATVEEIREFTAEYQPVDQQTTVYVEHEWSLGRHLNVKNFFDGLETGSNWDFKEKLQKITTPDTTIIVLRKTDQF